MVLSYVLLFIFKLHLISFSKALPATDIVYLIATTVGLPKILFSAKTSLSFSDNSISDVTSVKETLVPPVLVKL